MAYGELGPTHHSIEDLAWLRAIANLTVIVPADPARDPRRRSAGRRRPRAGVHPHQPRTRCPRSSRRSTTVRSSARRDQLRDGDDVTLIAIGTDGRARAGRRRQLRAEGIARARAEHVHVAPARRRRRARRRPRDRRHRHRRGGTPCPAGSAARSPRCVAAAAAGPDAHPRRARRVRAHRQQPTSCCEHFGLTAGRHRRRPRATDRWTR